MCDKATNCGHARRHKMAKAPNNNQSWGEQSASSIDIGQYDTRQEAIHSCQISTK